MNHSILRVLIIAVLTYIINPPGMSQTEMPDVLQKGNLPEQLNYIEERTRIYEYYRAIREDMFQLIKKNTIDTLTATRAEIADLADTKNTLNFKIDSLNKLISDTRASLDEAVRTKNNIKILGLDVNKFAYNSLMWIIVAILAALLVIGFLTLKRNIAVTRNTKKDLEDIKTEFEAYRKQSREAREKMSMDHFNEIRRLKAQGGSFMGSGKDIDTGFGQHGWQGLPPQDQKDDISQNGNNETNNLNLIKKPRKRGPGRSGQTGQQGNLEV